MSKLSVITDQPRSTLYPSPQSPVILRRAPWMPHHLHRHSTGTVPTPPALPNLSTLSNVPRVPAPSGRAYPVTVKTVKPSEGDAQPTENAVNESQQRSSPARSTKQGQWTPRLPPIQTPSQRTFPSAQPRLSPVYTRQQHLSSPTALYQPRPPPAASNYSPSQRYQSQGRYQPYPLSLPASRTDRILLSPEDDEPPMQDFPQRFPAPAIRGETFPSPPSPSAYRPESRDTMSPAELLARRTASERLARSRLSHIASEQRRRESINAGFDRLRALLSDVPSEGFTKAQILQLAADYVIHLEGCVRATRRESNWNHRSF